MDIKIISELFEKAPIMEWVAYFSLLNLAIILIEIAVDLINKNTRRWKDSIANISIFILGQLIERSFIGSLSILALLPFQHVQIFHIPPTEISWLWAILVADFTYYWMHRLEHEHRILWASHSVHHSSEDYNLTISMRLCIIENLVEWIFLIPMILLGFSPFQTVVALLLVAQYQTWIHTEKIGKLGWLDKIFNTPSVHRVHHGSNHQYLDKNYGGILIIWDRLFGTYQEEKEKVVYGLTKNIDTNHPIKINFIGYQEIWKDLKRCKNWKDRFKIIFGGLQWRPSYFSEKE